jgi:hypothetical protein
MGEKVVAQNRESHGGSARLLKELAAEDHSEYRSFLRMTPRQI